ncbi:MAG TPA: hypothetical protein VI756_08100, partial [Blastocatellia bacterium]
MKRTESAKLVALAAIFAIAIGVSINADPAFNPPHRQSPPESGAEIYAHQCAECHGTDGKAQ